ncbi:MAG: pyridoxal 5'-phosphate synthase glutaminase subunit PdxT [Chloroflexi bacterium]|nr:pyridoxal 5'-phosphate synthase glutaminase subunit PdxT [Chloroflexota bacterium]HLG51127.1 pyridoxal 5'-phosphate synthase glutaminase subunit PdxT [Chloroflexota bacterium]
MVIGVLALQGDFREHGQMLRRIGIDAIEVRLPADLARVDGLIIPGGESTTIGKLLVRFELMDLLRQRIADGFPVYGTCAGAIVLSNQVLDAAADQPVLGVLDVAIRRNAFGRQVDSFEVDLPVPILGDPPFHAVFIRAPIIERIGRGVEPLARLDDGTIVAVQQGHLLATAFHPELTTDGRFHQHFAAIVERSR